MASCGGGVEERGGGSHCRCIDEHIGCVVAGRGSCRVVLHLVGELSVAKDGHVAASKGADCEPACVFVLVKIVVFKKVAGPVVRRVPSIVTAPPKDAVELAIN